MTKTMAIRFDGPGEYGIHDGFFNATIVMDGDEYDIQCCVDSDGNVNWNDSGFDWGLCGDANEPIAEKIGWDNLLDLLKRAYSEYTDF